MKVRFDEGRASLSVVRGSVTSVEMWRCVPDTGGRCVILLICENARFVLRSNHIIFFLKADQPTRSMQHEQQLW